jgi:homoserine O-acetyltransferase
MGGMLALEWSFFGQDYVRHIIPIATSGKHSAWCVAHGEAQRQAIYSDPKYKNGYYSLLDPPKSGLAAARMAALLTYRSRDAFERKFSRCQVETQVPETNCSRQKAALFHNEGNCIRFHRVKPRILPASSSTPSADVANVPPVPKSKTVPQNQSVFSAQTYLRYQGDKFVSRFDANCYISITRKLDTHDVSRERGEYHQVLASIQQPTLVVGITSDGLFTLDEQKELAERIPNGELVVIESGKLFTGE